MNCQFCWKGDDDMGDAVMCIIGAVLGWIIGYCYGQLKVGKHYRKELKEMLKENDIIAQEFQSFQDDMMNAMKEKGII